MHLFPKDKLLLKQQEASETSGIHVPGLVPQSCFLSADPGMNGSRSWKRKNDLRKASHGQGAWGHGSSSRGPQRGQPGLQPPYPSVREISLWSPGRQAHLRSCADSAGRSVVDSQEWTEGRGDPLCQTSALSALDGVILGSNKRTQTPGSPLLTVRPWQVGEPSCPWFLQGYGEGRTQRRGQLTHSGEGQGGQ